MPKGAKYGGRKKGTPNKKTTEVKNALMEAFERLGGVEALVEFGRREPAEFYKLWVKILPAQIAGQFSLEVPLPKIYLEKKEARIVECQTIDSS